MENLPAAVIESDAELSILEITEDLQIARRFSRAIICNGPGAVIVDNKCMCSLNNTVLNNAIGKFLRHGKN